MTAFIVHDATGRIVRSGDCPTADIPHQARAGQAAMAGAGGDAAHWVDGGVIVPRPQIGVASTASVAVGVDWTVTGIPDGTGVFSDGESLGVVTGGEATITFPEVGIWVVDFRAPWPWLISTIEVAVS